MAEGGKGKQSLEITDLQNRGLFERTERKEQGSRASWGLNSMPEQWPGPAEEEMQGAVIY